MKTKLTALNAEHEMLQADYAVKYDAFMGALDKIINKWFVAPYEAKCTRRWIRTSHIEGELELCFELGFFNVEENRIDFGSDFWMDYSTQRNELRVNYGTCGYHSKTDVYQTKRVKLLAFIWDHIDEIETELKLFSSDVIPVATEYLNKQHEIQSEIYHIEKTIRQEREQEVESYIVPHSILYYPEESTLSRHSRLFGGKMTITRRTPKFVFANDEYGRECKFKIAEVIQHVVNNYMIIEGAC